MAPALTGRFESPPCDPFYLHDAVGFGVISRVPCLIPAALTEIYPSGKLAHYHEVETLSSYIRSEHAGFSKSRLYGSRSEICIQTKFLSESQKSFLRSHMIRYRIPLRSAHSTKHHTVCSEAAVYSLLRKRNSEFIQSTASGKICIEFKFAAELFRNGLKHFNSSSGHFRADSVARYQCDFIRHICSPL